MANNPPSPAGFLSAEALPSGYIRLNLTLGSKDGGVPVPPIVLPPSVAFNLGNQLVVLSLSTGFRSSFPVTVGSAPKAQTAAPAVPVNVTGPQSSVDGASAAAVLSPQQPSKSSDLVGYDFG